MWGFWSIGDEEVACFPYDTVMSFYYFSPRVAQHTPSRPCELQLRLYLLHKVNGAYLMQTTADINVAVSQDVTTFGETLTLEAFFHIAAAIDFYQSLG